MATTIRFHEFVNASGELIAARGRSDACEKDRSVRDHEWAHAGCDGRKKFLRVVFFLRCVDPSPMVID
ncbi:MAG TPA: hypothetical protein VFZ53_17690 [Polyangiaceae bacterium]